MSTRFVRALTQSGWQCLGQRRTFVLDLVELRVRRLELGKLGAELLVHLEHFLGRLGLGKLVPDVVSALEAEEKGEW